MARVYDSTLARQTARGTSRLCGRPAQTEESPEWLDETAETPERPRSNVPQHRLEQGQKGMRSANTSTNMYKLYS
jgi:hypothetical protein